MSKKNINSYDVILFDFDGLLVDTEPLHFLAYKKMCLKNQVVLNWDFTRFCQEAHGTAQGIWKALHKEYPWLFANSSQEILYDQKKEIYQGLLKIASPKLMPGVKNILQTLTTSNILSAVVTNSPRSQVEAICRELPLLHVIPLWITREDYKLAKPEPDGYLRAIEKLGGKNRVIGFEDTMKGVRALQAARVEAVLVSSRRPREIKDFEHVKRIDRFFC